MSKYNNVVPHVDSERKIQNKAIKLLRSVHGFGYIGNLKDVENSNIRENDVLEFLTEKQGCTQAQAREALKALESVSYCTDSNTL